MVQKYGPGLSRHSFLVKVKAVSINPLEENPYEGNEMMSGSKFPKRIGVDFEGIIDVVGEKVKNFKAGDEVFGVINSMKEGALGEFVLVPVTSVCRKPANFSFVQAASIPVVGVCAYRAIGLCWRSRHLCVPCSPSIRGIDSH